MLSAPSTATLPAALTRSEYRRLIAAVQRTVQATIPAGSNVLVVSKGDDELLQLPGRLGWHFPQVGRGVYAGEYPADSTQAIEQVERLIRQGAQFMVFPATSYWWLSYYDGLLHFLDHTGQVLYNDKQTCAIYCLNRADAAGLNDPNTRPEGSRLAELVDALFEPDARLILATTGGPEVSIGERQVTSWQPNRVNALHDLDHLRRLGAQFLVVPHGPQTLGDQFPDLFDALASTYRCVVARTHLCSIFDITQDLLVGSERQ